MNEVGIELDGDETGYPVLPTVGAQLRAAREAKGLSLAEAAQSLKLGVRQIEAVENGNWQALPGVTFARGFVRNYARLVQIDAGSLMEQLDSVLDAKRPELVLPENLRTSLPAPVGGGPLRRDYVMVAIGLLILLLATLSYFFLPDDLAKMRDSARSFWANYSRSSAPVTTPPVSVVQESVLPPGSSIGQVINPQSTQLLEVPSTLSATPAPNESPSNGTAAATSATPMKISFVKESWVEVRDRRGNVIFSQRGVPGVDKDIDGEAPFTLVIGYAPGVSIKYRGQNVDLTPHSRGDVARLTLE